MNTPRTPSAKSLTKTTSTETPSPGNWKHPRMAEIVKRRKDSTFDGSNVLRITYNIMALLASFVAIPIMRSYVPVVLSAINELTNFLGTYQSAPISALRLVFVYNVYQACQPLWKVPDTLSDIPLTPSQRQLLGLDPGSGKANTPKTEYITPPKYRRSTPRSQSPAWSQGRPGSGSGTQRTQLPGGRDGLSGSTNGSPFGGQASRREVSRDLTGERVDGSERKYQGGLGDSTGPSNANSLRDSLRESSGIWVPSTPTPSGRGTGASVGLNSKWLYERGRSSSGSRRSFGGI